MVERDQRTGSSIIASRVPDIKHFTPIIINTMLINNPVITRDSSMGYLKLREEKMNVSLTQDQSIRNVTGTSFCTVFKVLTLNYVVFCFLFVPL